MANSFPASAVVIPVALLKAVEAAMQANYPGPTLAAAWDAVKACAATQGDPPHPATTEDLRYLWCAAGGVFVTTPGPSGRAMHDGVMPVESLYTYLRSIYQRAAYWREEAYEKSIRTVSTIQPTVPEGRFPQDEGGRHLR